MSFDCVIKSAQWTRNCRMWNGMESVNNLWSKHRNNFDYAELYQQEISLENDKYINAAQKNMLISKFAIFRYGTQGFLFANIVNAVTNRMSSQYEYNLVRNIFLLWFLKTATMLWKSWVGQSLDFCFCWRLFETI